MGTSDLFFDGQLTFFAEPISAWAVFCKKVSYLAFFAIPTVFTKRLLELLMRIGTGSAPPVMLAAFSGLIAFVTIPTVPL